MISIVWHWGAFLSSNKALTSDHLTSNLIDFTRAVEKKYDLSLGDDYERLWYALPLYHPRNMSL